MKEANVCPTTENEKEILSLIHHFEMHKEQLQAPKPEYAFL